MLIVSIWTRNMVPDNAGDIEHGQRRDFGVEADGHGVVRAAGIPVLRRHVLVFALHVRLQLRVGLNGIAGHPGVNRRTAQGGVQHADRHIQFALQLIREPEGDGRDVVCGLGVAHDPTAAGDLVERGWPNGAPL